MYVTTRRRFEGIGENHGFSACREYHFSGHERVLLSLIHIFLAMFGKSGVYARSVFLKAHFFGQPFKVLKVDKTLVDYYTKLSDFHAQFRAVGTNYNQVVKELRLHFSEKKAMALLYKLEQHTVELVKLSRRIVELSREMEAKWSQKSV